MESEVRIGRPLGEQGIKARRRTFRGHPLPVESYLAGGEQSAWAQGWPASVQTLRLPFSVIMPLGKFINLSELQRIPSSCGP